MRPSTSGRSLNTIYSSTPGLKPSFMESGLSRAPLFDVSRTTSPSARPMACGVGRRKKELILGDRKTRVAIDGRDPFRIGLGARQVMVAEYVPHDQDVAACRRDDGRAAG